MWSYMYNVFLCVRVVVFLRRRRQKRKEELMHHDQEMQKGKRLAKLLNEHRTRDRGPRRVSF